MSAHEPQRSSLPPLPLRETEPLERIDPEQQLLLSLTERLATSPGDLAPALVEGAAAHTRADAAGLFLLDAPGGALRALTSVGTFSEDGAREACRVAIERAGAVEVPRPDGAGELLAVPMTADERAMGALWLAGSGFEPADLRLATSLARFAAAALRVVERERARDARESKAALRTAAIRRLQALSVQAAGADGSLHQRIVDTAAEVMRSDMASLQAYEPEQDTLHLLAQRGFPSAAVADWERVTPDSACCCGRALREGRRVVQQDVEVGERASGIRSMQSTPLRSRSGRLLGMLSTHWREPDRIDDADQDLMDLIARQAADALENAEARRSLAESARQKDALYRLVSRLQRATSLEGVYDAAVDAITEAVRCERASILLSDEAGVMRFVAWRGLSDEYRRAVEGHSPWTAQEPDPQPVQVEDAGAQVDDEALRAQFAREGIGSMTFTPLVAEGRLIGKFMAYFRAPRRFGREEVELGLAIARQLAVGIERVRTVEALRESDRRKDEFLATLAHELRNPLAPLQSALELLELAGDASPAAREARDMMQRQLAQLVRLIDDLLDVSRISRGKFELRRSAVELVETARRAVESALPLARERGQELTLQLPSEPIRMHADGARLTQILHNLISNACKFTPEGGRIRVEVEREGEGEVALRVADTGVGIPREELSRIFELFVQVGTAPGQRGGLGIGLTLVRDLALMHGGRVEAQSEGPGRGSEFTVRLPVQPPPVERAPDEAEPATRACDPRRVLVVDDNVDAADSLAKLLRLGGHQVRTAYDGEGALAVAEELRPELVLLDIGLPRMDGYEVARRMRRRDWARGVLLVALTGWGQEADRQRSREAGFDVHLVKPVDQKRLREVMGAG